MKGPLLLAPAAGLLLLGAYPPELDSVVAADAPKGGYPPCTATRTDRCVQGREHDAEATPAPAPVETPRVAAAPVSVVGDYPPCTATRTDRCTQGRGHRAVPVRRMQLAMRAGERG